MILTATWRMGIHLFSATVVALLVAGIFLTILVPPADLDKFTDDLIDGSNYYKQDKVAVNIFCAIYIITLIVIVWYVLDKAYNDRVPCI